MSALTLPLASPHSRVNEPNVFIGICKTHEEKLRQQIQCASEIIADFAPLRSHRVPPERGSPSPQHLPEEWAHSAGEYPGGQRASPTWLIHGAYQLLHVGSSLDIRGDSQVPFAEETDLTAALA